MNKIPTKAQFKKNRENNNMSEKKKRKNVHRKAPLSLFCICLLSLDKRIPVGHWESLLIWALRKVIVLVSPLAPWHILSQSLEKVQMSCDRVDLKSKEKTFVYSDTIGPTSAQHILLTGCCRRFQSLQVGDTMIIFLFSSVHSSFQHHEYTPIGMQFLLRNQFDFSLIDNKS